MANPNKAKGTAWETALVRFIADRTGLPLRRVAQTGRLDTGDLHGIPDFTLQAKDCARFELSSWLDDVQRQAGAADVRYGAVVAKRRQRPIGDAYVILRLDDFAELIQRLYGPCSGL